MSDAFPQFTPVTLITGFLGSGKTTLLQRLLRSPSLSDTAVLINEFGEIGLDHHLLERIDARTVLLQSGCLCCTVRGELSEALRDLHSKRARGIIPPFRRVAIESTGLADPFPVLTTLHADPVLKYHFRIAAVVTTVDAVNGSATLAGHLESVKQVAVADRIMLTKTDLASAAAVGTIERRVRAINPVAPLLRSSDTAALADRLLSSDALDKFERDPVSEAWFAEELRAADSGVKRHVDDVRAFAIILDRPLDWTSFGIWLTMLLHRHGDKILRVKGILNVSGANAPVALHGVQYLVHPPTYMQAWPDDDRRSRIVFIVKQLEAALIEQSLGAFCRLDAGTWRATD